MRIKNTGYSIYPYSTNGGKDTVQMDTAAKSGKSSLAAPSLSKERVPNGTTRIDKIELNCHSSYCDSFLTSLRESICDDISKDISLSRLQNLKDTVENGNYSLDSGALAKALLSDKEYKDKEGGANE